MGFTVVGGRIVEIDTIDDARRVPRIVAAALDNVGVTDDARPYLGNLDGSGFSYSADALAAAGFTPGGSVSAGGFEFTWPAAAAGTPDNAVAHGQRIALSGQGSTLAFLVSSGGQSDHGLTHTRSRSDGARSRCTPFSSEETPSPFRGAAPSAITFSSTGCCRRS